jgi:hypothetical protein
MRVYTDGFAVCQFASSTKNGKNTGYDESINDGDAVIISLAQTVAEQAEKYGIRLDGKKIYVNGKPSPGSCSIKDGDEVIISDEDIEVKVSSFYAKIKEPVMTNLAVAFTGDVKTSQLYPNALPDIFKGETLQLFGRYSGSGAASVKITGTIDGKEQTLTEDVRFDSLAAASTRREDPSDHHFIATLWATRRVGYLLDQIRQHGENAELKNEIVTLASSGRGRSRGTGCR